MVNQVKEGVSFFLNTTRTLTQNTLVATSTALRSLKYFTAGFNNEINKQFDRGTPLGKVVWVHPNREEIREEIKAIKKEHNNGDFGPGILDVFHCTRAWTMEELLKQQEESPDGSFEHRMNSAGQGLFVGNPEGCWHYGGTKPENDVIVEVQSKGSISENTTDPTGQVYLNSGGIVTKVYKINKEYAEFKRPWLARAVMSAAEKGLEEVKRSKNLQ